MVGHDKAKTDTELGDDLCRALAEYDEQQKGFTVTPPVDGFAQDLARIARGEMDADEARTKFAHLLKESE